MNPKAILDAVVFGSVIAVLSLEDLRRRRIPDQIVGIGLITSLLVSHSLRETIAGALAGLVPFLVVRVVCPGRLGLGDVKFSAYLGAVLGPGQWWITTLTACITALLFLLVRAAALRAALGTSLPFAPFLSAAALLCLFLDRLTPLHPWGIVP